MQSAERQIVMKPTPVYQDQENRQRVITTLRDLGSLKWDYPPKLLTSRRASFQAQIDKLAHGSTLPSVNLLA